MSTVLDRVEEIRGKVQDRVKKVKAKVGVKGGLLGEGLLGEGGLLGGGLLEGASSSGQSSIIEDVRSRIQTRLKKSVLTGSKEGSSEGILEKTGKLKGAAWRPPGEAIPPPEKRRFS